MSFKQLAALALPAIASAAALPQTATIQIVGGEAAAEGEFPFIVSLQLQGSHFCGASLLDSTTVVTAAHCTEDQVASDLSVRAGSLLHASGGVTAQVESIAIHPSFDPSTLDHDVSILKLSTPIEEDGSIAFAVLPEDGQDPAADSDATVAGWGALSSGGAGPAELQKVTVPVIGREDCQSMYSVEEVTDNMFCAGFVEGGKDSCQGDSGGPIVDEEGTLIGLVSWGKGCASPNNPGVYARVGTLLDFIEGSNLGGGNGTSNGTSPTPY